MSPVLSNYNCLFHELAVKFGSDVNKLYLATNIQIRSISFNKENDY